MHQAYMSCKMEDNFKGKSRHWSPVSVCDVIPACSMFTLSENLVTSVGNISRINRPIKVSPECLD